MYYVWHYSFFGKNLDELSVILKSDYNLSSKFSPIVGSNKVTHTLTVDVPETHPDFENIIRLISQDRWKEKEDLGKELRPSVYFPEYSEEEFLSAKWLTVRSLFDKIMYKAKNHDEIIREDCLFVKKGKYTQEYGRHRYSRGPYVISSPIKWGRNFFASGFSEQDLFCNSIAKTILETNQIQGIEYGPVFKGTKQTQLDDIYEMNNTFTLPTDAIVGQTYTRKCTCPDCGMQMVAFSDARFKFVVREECIPKNVDYLKTLPMFTRLGPLEDTDKIVHAHDDTLISQKLYRLIKDCKMDRSLWFEPIETI